MSSIHRKLADIQVKLVAKKNAYNKHGKYHYRNIESILESLKPLLKERDCFVHMTDDIALIGDRYYVKATVSIIDEKGESVSSTAYSREPVKGMGGMSESQTTGSSSSYARKYALSGLFAIDDGADDDSLNDHKPQKNGRQGQNNGYQNNGNQNNGNQNNGFYNQQANNQPQPNHQLTAKGVLEPSREDAVVKTLQNDTNWSVERIQKTYALTPEQVAKFTQVVQARDGGQGATTMQ